MHRPQYATIDWAVIVRLHIAWSIVSLSLSRVLEAADHMTPGSDTPRCWVRSGPFQAPIADP